MRGPTVGQFRQLKDAARGRWQGICTSFGVPVRFLHNHHGPCPACGGKDRFRFDDINGDGTFFCNRCGPGDGFRLLRLYSGQSFNEVLRFVAAQLGLVPRDAVIVSEHRQVEDSMSKVRAVFEQVWSSAKRIESGDPCDKYLRVTRRLRIDVIPDCIRFAKLPYYKDRAFQGDFPAMVAAVTSETGELIGVHRTFLLPNGEKAPVDCPKKLMRSLVPLRGASIKLFPANKELGIAEGIETALAAFSCTGIPVWSSVSASLMKTVIVPSSVKTVFIFADNDENGVGQEAATSLAERLGREGRQVKLLLPPHAGADWADVVTGCCNG